MECDPMEAKGFYIPYQGSVEPFDTTKLTEGDLRAAIGEEELIRVTLQKDMLLIVGLYGNADINLVATFLFRHAGVPSGEHNLYGHAVVIPAFDDPKLPF
jgi:hypothetical protein